MYGERIVIDKPFVNHQIGIEAHDYVDLVLRDTLQSNKGSEFVEEDMDVLKTKVRILEIKQDQRDDVSVSLSERHKLENTIIELQEALVCEKGKSMNLERELNETYKKIRMLNKGFPTLDKILSMGRTEKTTMGLGYQGGLSGSHTVFVRSNFVEPSKTNVFLGSATNLAKEFPTLSIVYTRYCKICLVPYQDYVHRIWSTRIMFDILKTQRWLIGEELVSILHQRMTFSTTGQGVVTINANMNLGDGTSTEQSNNQYWNLHRANLRLSKKEEMEFCDADKVGEDVHNNSGEDSGEEPNISQGLEFHRHHSLKKHSSLARPANMKIIVSWMYCSRETQPS